MLRACPGVTRTLQAIPGVSDVNVSLTAGEASVQYDERLTSSEQLRSAVQRAGYTVNAVKPTLSQQGKGGCCG